MTWPTKNDLPPGRVVPVRDKYAWQSNLEATLLVASKMVKLHQKYFRQKIGSKNEQQKNFKNGNDSAFSWTKWFIKKIFLQQVCMTMCHYFLLVPHYVMILFNFLLLLLMLLMFKGEFCFFCTIVRNRGNRTNCCSQRRFFFNVCFYFCFCFCFISFTSLNEFRWCP